MGEEAILCDTCSSRPQQVDDDLDLASIVSEAKTLPATSAVGHMIQHISKSRSTVPSE